MARKILLADDSVTAQNMGRKILADAGYEVIAVNNGSAALKKVGEIKPDLVVLDVYMPGYSGLEVCQRLKESHDTARIPVLLTVGKLEPFKPEEAQRVRAEAFIVKPFEASELLSALSKLEDKVVPRPEPSRPGRFARAIAAVEESGRGRGEDNGWKNRISFPHEKTEAEQQAEKVEEQAATYNPVNRDLRTVVETPAERAEEKAYEQELTGKQESPGREIEKVDAAALAPSAVSALGLPRDVTQEELGAVAAAAAQIQAATAAIQEEERSAEGPGQAAPEPAPETVGFEPPMREIDLDAAAPPIMQARPVSEDKAGAGSSDSESREARSHETNGGQDVPVTMAATADSVTNSGGSSRWTAVAVALDGNEAELSLDDEMQKANAPLQANTVEPASLSATAGFQSTSTEANADVAVATPAQESAPAHEASPAFSIASDETSSSSTAHIDSPLAVVGTNASAEQATDLAERTSTFEHQPETADTSFVQDPAASPSAESEAQNEVTTGAQTVRDVQSSAAEHTAPETEAVPASTESMPEAEGDAVAETVDLGYHAFRSSRAQSEAPPAMDHEVVKNTAAAWASWRQIRDTGNAVQPELDHRQEFDASTPSTEANAAAAAAGAEQSLPPANPQEHENASDVASIVDSVLADLRPKLMKEISRKIAEKK